MGHLLSFQPASSALRMLLVHPALATRSAPSNVFTMMEDCLNGLYSGEVICDCGMACKEPIRSRISRFGSMLAINVVWPISQLPDPVASGSIRRFASGQFPISTEIDLSSLVAQTSKRRNVSATLVGAICRVGGRIDEGHYVCIVSENNDWWRIDNEHVTGVSSTSEFFESGQAPVLLLYRCEERGDTASEPLRTRLKTDREEIHASHVTNSRMCSFPSCPKSVIELRRRSTQRGYSPIGNGRMEKVTTFLDVHNIHEAENQCSPEFPGEITTGYIYPSGELIERFQPLSGVESYL